MSEHDTARETGDDEAEPITVFADYVCPFCYLGRESLDRYQAQREEPLEIEWHPFDLRAGQRGPDGEIDEDAESGKDEAYFERARENVRRLQEQYDVEMNQEIAQDVDSLPAQLASVAVADEYPYEDWLAFDEAIYDALWRDGRDVGDPDVLADLAEDVGIDPEDVRSAIDDEDRRDELEAAFQRARRAGVTGVPTFTYGEHAARGAVPPEQLRRLVEGS